MQMDRSVLRQFVLIPTLHWGSNLLHSVSSYKERCKILTSLFFKFSQIFYSFCSLFFKIWTVVVLKISNFFCTNFENDLSEGKNIIFEEIFDGIMICCSLAFLNLNQSCSLNFLDSTSVLYKGVLYKKILSVVGKNGLLADPLPLRLPTQFMDGPLFKGKCHQKL